MSWIKIQPAAAVKASGVKAWVRVRANGGVILCISMPTTLAGPAWERADRFDAFWGEGDLAGKMCVECAKDGDFRISRFKGHLILRCSAPVYAEERATVIVPFEKDGGKFILTLPDWTKPSQEKQLAQALKEDLKSVEPAPSGKPERLQLVGNILVVDGHNIRLGGTEAKAMEALCAEFGNTIDLRRITADSAVVVQNLRAKLASTCLDLINERGAGYRLAMRSAQAA